MTDINAVIVEDELLMSTILVDLLQENHSHIHIRAVATSGKEAIQLITQLEPDLVFLDIELTDMNAFQMLDELKQINFKTIFTTAHSQYAIKAFRFNALDYLVKPINPNELRESISRLYDNDDNVIQALKNYKENNTQEQKLQLHTHQGLLQFHLKDIVCVSGERNYSQLQLANGKTTLSSKNLSYFEELLSEKDFFRCHRSYLVNVNHIDRVVKENFIMKNEMTIPISRRKKSLAMEWFENMNTK